MSIGVRKKTRDSKMCTVVLIGRFVDVLLCDGPNRAHDCKVSNSQAVDPKWTLFALLHMACKAVDVGCTNGGRASLSRALSRKLYSFGFS